MASKKRYSNIDRQLSAVDKQAEAMRLRRLGWSFARIAEAVGYADKSGAYAAVQAGLKATLREPADELRTLELDRLDAALEVVMEEIEAHNLSAVDKLIRLMERRATLLGLDAPRKITGDEDRPVEIRIRYVD